MTELIHSIRLSQYVILSANMKTAQIIEGKEGKGEYQSKQHMLE